MVQINKQIPKCKILLTICRRCEQNYAEKLTLLLLRHSAQAQKSECITDGISEYRCRVMYGTLYHAAVESQHSEKDQAKPAPETCSLRRISHPTPHAGSEVGNPAPMEDRDAALKKWATENPCRPGPGWPAEPPTARQPSHEDSGRTPRSTQVGKSPRGQLALTATMNDAFAGPRPSPIGGNAAGMSRIRVHRQHSVRRRQSARSEHGDAEPADGEPYRIEVTEKQLMGKQNPDTPVSMCHPAVPAGRHEWTETLICHRH
ncbi:hypothetical protein T08_1793 [Trichinella sp. T8]|nr:hypothetical protein T08_1793 [Trichinella sp. T8]